MCQPHDPVVPLDERGAWPGRGSRRGFGEAGFDAVSHAANIFPTMRYAILLAGALWACGTPRADRRAPDLPEFVARDSADSVLHAPRVVSEAAVVVFWLPASDTLHPDDAAAAYGEMTVATEGVMDALTAFDIKLYPTNADTLYIALPNRRRRAVPLSGLDYPFGYVLVEPDGAERVLPGVYGQAELLDEIRAYFDLPDDTLSAPRVVTD